MIPITTGTIVGEYRLAERIGAGGMGEVFRAEHVTSGRVVAVKVFGKNVFEARDLARFYQEARIHRSLVHANIAECYELVTVGSTPCLVMEFLGGDSLAGRLQRRGRLSPADALALAAAIARGVAHAHDHGVVHRDIKPANVRAAADGTMKLLDFGIARTAESSGLTAAGKVIGTPQYLSPEQLLGETATPASDVWALGVLLYEAVTGIAPFTGETDEALWKQINSGRVALPSTLVSSPESAEQLQMIDALVLDCLVRDPRRRRLTASEFAEAAIKYREGREGREGGRLKTALRHRRAIAVAVVVIALAALAYSLSGTIPENERGVHHIDANRMATVYINGRRIGRTPVDYTGRIGDAIDVRIEADGAEPQQARIELTTNGTTTFTISDRRERP
jgi:serine/threonine protein kinase